VTFLAWALRTGQVARPMSLKVLYADTRQELPPLQATAVKLLQRLEREGIETQMVLPEMDDRFYVYMLGYGVPPPSNRFRWCTPKLKVEPMMRALQARYESAGERLLSITGVRLGESAARDQRIAVSCSKDSGECGQGWFHVASGEAIADTLAPLVHWRLCHVYDWLYFEQPRHGYDEVIGIADVYGDGDVRTGCIGCPLASRDNALEALVKRPEWGYLSPLLELKPMFREMKKARNRKRKAEPEALKGGGYAKNGQRMGPLTMAARGEFFEQVLEIQGRCNAGRGNQPVIDLINEAEQGRIREMWAGDMWPRKWSADDIDADVPIADIRALGNELIYQPLMV
jgi:DNA sulfur modification protein DndC